MRISALLGSAALTVTLSPALSPATAWADGPRSAYDSGGVIEEASLDPGEEQMTVDEENKARLKDLSDAYHSGYNARAKEDAETYASLRDQLKRTKTSAQQPPPLPSGEPGDDGAQVRRVSQARVAQQRLQAAYDDDDAAAPVQYAPPAARPRYRSAPAPVMYTQAPVYDGPSAEEMQTVVFQPYQAPMPMPMPVQYVQSYQPVYVSPAPVVPVQYAAAYPVYRPYGYGWR
ncbi:hypothetical protein PPMP20_37935 [Paraburkholderia phymatum]|uniref:Uncharacterized protein n=1 Tax=Paraburkholderia phymatum (strain DSM 17167 / CIP 108236 / LMG 21445 / STM815) TaxID=391038 RepID=B2JV46_PARP8|nr:hypothetical protein [Paraburkholderia phymatum]ACC74823.1 hypothetical protein Bphy_5757 [Paraburkholderia phymatum STM815]